MKFKRILAAVVASAFVFGSTAFAEDTAVMPISTEATEVDKNTDETTVAEEATEETTELDESTEETTAAEDSTEETTEPKDTTEAATEIVELPFSDVDSESAQGKAIAKMYGKGYLKGYEDGTFKPNGFITRAELTRVFNQVFGYGLNEEAAVNMKDFTDNFDSTAWYYDDVRIAQSNGYIKGFEDGSFRPKENFTREQTCTVIYAVALADKDHIEIAAEINDPVSQWAAEYVNCCVVNNVFELEDGGLFRAKENITRGEVCEALAKFVNDEGSYYIAAEETTTDIEETTEAATNSETGTETTSSAPKSSGGGGGGGSSSGGGGGSSSGGGSGSSSGGGSSTTETTTEATTINPADIQMDDTEKDALANVIKTTKEKFIPRLYKSSQKELARTILAALEAYYADSNYDFRGDIETAKSMYHNLPDDERTEFENVAGTTYNMSDINILMPLFREFI